MAHKHVDLLHDLDLTVQINTTVCSQNVNELYELYELYELDEVVARYHAVMWRVFFLVPIWRGRLADIGSAAEHERIFHWLYDFAPSAPFDVRTTAAPQYRRVLMQRDSAERQQACWHAHAGFQFSLGADGILRSALGVNDGKGFCFVTHLGEIQPSGFLPVTAGVFPRDSLAETYRGSPLFKELRDPSRLGGKCGICEFR